MVCKQTDNRSKDTQASLFVSISPGQRVLIVMAFWVLLLVIILVAMINGTAGAPLVIALLTVSVLVYLFPLIHYKKEYGWFHPLVFTSLLYFYGLLRKWEVYAFGLQSRGLIGYDTQAQSLVLAYSLILVIMAQIAYYVGYFAGPKLSIPRAIQFSQPVKLQAKAILVVVATLVPFGFYIVQQGGLDAHFLFLSQGRSSLVRQGLLSGEWVVITRFGVLACLIWLLYDRGVVRNPWFLVLFSSSLISQYLVAGSRSNLVNFVIITFIAYTLSEQKVRITRVITIVIIAISFIGAAGELRAGTWKQEVLWQVLLSPDIEQSFTAGIEEIASRGSELSALYPIIVKVPNKVNLLYGQAYINFLTTPIPRALWRSKPQGFGNQIGPLFFGLSAPIPPGPIGEAFWNFHIPGVLIVFFLYGVFHEWLTRLFLRYGKEPAIILLFAYIVFRFSPEVYSATLLFQFGVSILLLLMFFGVISLSRKFTAQRSQEIRNDPLRDA